jgi:hypothetical protein
MNTVDGSKDLALPQLRNPFPSRIRTIKVAGTVFMCQERFLSHMFWFIGLITLTFFHIPTAFVGNFVKWDRGKQWSGVFSKSRFGKGASFPVSATGDWPKWINETCSLSPTWKLNFVIWGYFTFNLIRCGKIYSNLLEMLNTLTYGPFLKQ